MQQLQQSAQQQQPGHSRRHITEWYNPLDVPQKLKFYQGPKLPAQEYEIAPKQSEMIPSVYDQAIQTVDSNGTIIAGMAPCLINKSVQAPPTLHQALDLAFQERQRREGEAMRATLRREAAESMELLAKAKLGQVVIEDDAAREVEGRASSSRPKK